MGEMEFFPKSIFENKYYPYYGKLRHVSESFIVVGELLQQQSNLKHPSGLNLLSLFSQVNYSSPVVAVRFMGVQQGANIQVQCKLNGKGIINDSPTDRYLGSVTFSLEVGA